MPKSLAFPPVEEQLRVIQRGAVEIIDSKELREKLEKSYASGVPLRVKAGFDPTATDLHLGNALVVRKLVDFQRLGHQVCALIGDFTGMIGDPTGVSETRKPLSPKELKTNAVQFKQQLFLLLDPQKTELVYNSSWLNRLRPQELVALCSKYSVARMLEREDFHQRYRDGQSIRIHEFLYPLFQGYDSVALKADIELGGQDQKFNLLVGRDLQRDWGQPPQSLVMLPILEGLDGVRKMSKSFDNYIGISEAPEEIFGKVMSISDQLMWRYYELWSDVPMKDVARLRRACEAGEHNPRDAKAALGRELVARFHSPEEAEAAARDFEARFKRKETPQEIERVELKAPDKASELRLTHAIAQTGMAASASEAARLIGQGGVRLDGCRVEDKWQQLQAGREYLVQVGKRKFRRIFIAAKA